MNRSLFDLGDGIWMVDLMERGLSGRTGSYILPGEKNAIIETGGSLSLPQITAGIQEAGLSLDAIDYILLTHIHLDHAGSAGSLAAVCPKAKVVVHPRGVRHLADPTRLVAGARTVYGDRLESLFGEVLPVPADRLIAADHGETLDLGSRKLTFYHTPGHAKHHVSIFDPVGRGVFTGDTTGIRYHRELTGLEQDYILPTTTPTDFDPKATHESVALLRSLRPAKVFFGHFGATDAVDWVFDETERLVDAVAQLTEKVYRPDIALEEMARHLKSFALDDMKQTVGTPHSDAFLDDDMLLNAMGLLHWYSNR
ncbi:MBL fold metallo-hydrolase [Kyrpidia spormannii]|uniref:MBL fold metallo-hydrolase n=1 Tax=Kyrpidia spormannii TaxID=2055160 RepID=A0A6F9E4I3_9BACL|nr:MBL fold metallo-hydrolase [Kyrpidia spormannii]CAB3391409.1 MBL fold metallo-hydrolase [Kyrpidia spormannii]